MDIEVVKEDITTLSVTAIVSPANSQLMMGGGLARLIRKKGGDQVYDEAQEQKPVPVGEAVLTSAGELPAEHIIHAPTMERPAIKVSAENTEKAMQAVLTCAERNDIPDIAVPGLGTGVGSVESEAAATAMVQAITAFEGSVPQNIILVGYKEKLYKAFQDAVENR